MYGWISDYTSLDYLTHEVLCLVKLKITDSGGEYSANCTMQLVAALNYRRITRKDCKTKNPAGLCERQPEGVRGPRCRFCARFHRDRSFLLSVFFDFRGLVWLLPNYLRLAPFLGGAGSVFADVAGSTFAAAAGVSAACSTPKASKRALRASRYARTAGSRSG
jgi:hypothetical protein